MAVTSEEVRAALDREDYEDAAKLGPEALPHLRRFVESGDPVRAPKAAYLAGRIGDPEAAPILELAAASSDPSVRAAAAGGAAHLPAEESDRLVRGLLDDDDPSVRKLALRAVPKKASADLAAKVKVLQEHEPEDLVRDVAKEVHGRLKK